MLICLPISTQAERQDRATVSIAIKVSPIAQIDFPSGTDFELDIPGRPNRHGSRRGGPPPHLDTAQVPFTITGNSPVTVRALPGVIFRQDHKGILGKAFSVPGGGASADAVLGYRLRLEFPLGHPRNPLAGFGKRRGKNHTGLNRLTADPSQGPLSGIVHVIPNENMGSIASGKFGHPGRYRGSVQVILSTD